MELPWWLRWSRIACTAEDSSSIPGSERSPGEGNGYPLQYSCLENPMDKGAWWATVHGVAKNWTWLYIIYKVKCNIISKCKEPLERTETEPRSLRSEVRRIYGDGRIWIRLTGGGTPGALGGRNIWAPHKGLTRAPGAAGRLEGPPDSTRLKRDLPKHSNPQRREQTLSPAPSASPHHSFNRLLAGVPVPSPLPWPRNSQDTKDQTPSFPLPAQKLTRASQLAPRAQAPLCTVWSHRCPPTPQPPSQPPNTPGTPPSHDRLCSCPGGRAVLSWRKPCARLRASLFSGKPSPSPPGRSNCPALPELRPPHMPISRVSISTKMPGCFSLHSLQKDTAPGTSGHSVNMSGVQLNVKSKYTAQF